MKNILLILSLIVCSASGYSQKETGGGLYTDREIYVSGETVLAKLYIPENKASQIVYLDLVNRYGSLITGASLAIRNNEADGYLPLPDSLSTGTYLIRMYQKNTARKFKILREIWITNRFEGLDKINQLNRAVISEKIPEKNTEQIDFENIEPKYKTNCTLSSSVKIGESLLKEIDGNLLMYIAKTDSSFTTNAFILKSDQEKEGLKENKGIIFSGTINDKKTSEPAAGITVYLTVPDSVPGFQYYKTQNDGRFYFHLDEYYGPVQAVVQCFGNSPGQRLTILPDSFFAEPGALPEFSKLPIPEAFINNVTQDIGAVTFQKIFGQDKLKLLPPTEKKHDSYPYYGKPTLAIDPQLFIDLPNFAEISRELLPGVKFRNYNNEPTLQVINSQVRNYFDEKPLILMDGIPIRDLNLIKDLGTNDIDRVEICQSERFYGDLRFPGVVAIYTTRANYSRLPESGQFILLKLETVQLPLIQAEPETPEPNIPDLRQVICWYPSVKPESTLPIKCRTSSVSGQYKLVVRGKLKNGTLIFAEKQFEVK